jgi:putative hemolysin
MLFLIVFILLTLIYAYFSAIEFALVSIRPFRIQQAFDEGNTSAKKLLTLLKDPEKYLSAVQVGMTLVAIVEGIYGGEALQQYLEPRLLHFGLAEWLAHGLSLIIGIGIITYFTILLGELFPKTLALRNPQRVALTLTPSFLVFIRLFSPIVQLLTWGTHILLRLFPSKSSESKNLTDADLKSLLSLAYRQGTLEEYELKLHENIFTFYDLRVYHIMTPLNEVIVIKESMTREEITSVIRESQHNFFPVVNNNNLVRGFLSAKEFLISPDSTLGSLVQPVCKFQKEDGTSDVLLKFKKSSVNFGVVTNGDELHGIVTIHDIGEALIGEYA